MKSTDLFFRILAALLALLIPFFMSATALAVEDGSSRASFTDVGEDDPHSGDIEAVAEAGLMNGTGDGAFSPNMPLSRAMVVTVLYRFAGEPEAEFAGEFRDVDAGAYFASATAWACRLGIVNGRGDGIFAPYDNVDRQELACMLWRYAKVLGVDVGANGAVMPDFEDRERISSWAGEAVSWAFRAGILEMTDRNILPLGGVLRGEFCAMLVRFLRLKAGPGLPTA